MLLRVRLLAMRVWASTVSDRWQNAVNYGFDSAVPDGGEPRCKIFNIADKCAAQLLLGEEEIADVERDRCSRHEAHCHNDTKRFNCLDRSLQYITTQTVDCYIHAAAVRPLADCLHEIPFIRIDHEFNSEVRGQFCGFLVQDRHRDLGSKCSSNLNAHDAGALSTCMDKNPIVFLDFAYDLNRTDRDQQGYRQCSYMLGWQTGCIAQQPALWYEDILSVVPEIWMPGIE